MTEIAVRPTADVVEYQQDPTGGRLVAWAQAASAANALARSLVQTAFVPRVKVGQTMVPLSVGDATAAILMGDELGLSPLAALRSIYVVHGTPALYARTMAALVVSRGHEVWTESTSDAKVVVCGRRKGSDHVERAEWTIQRATKANYTSNAKYASTPQEMLYAKAAAEVSRKVAPDVLAGIPYSVEDLELEDVATVTVSREPAAPRKVARAPKPEPVEPAFDDGVKTDPVEPDPEPVETVAEPLRTEAQSKRLWTMLTEAGLTGRDHVLAWLTELLGRDVDSTKTLTKSECTRAMDALEASPADGAA